MGIIDKKKRGLSSQYETYVKYITGKFQQNLVEKLFTDKSYLHTFSYNDVMIQHVILCNLLFQET